MRVFSYVALIGSIQAKAVKNGDNPKLPADFFDAPSPIQDKASKKAAKKEKKMPPGVPQNIPNAPHLVPQAPPRQMPRRPIPTLPSSYKPLFHADQGFRSFAQKNNFPPLMEERKILQRTYQANPNMRMPSALAPQDYRNINYFNNLANNQQNNKNKNLHCMVCNGRSYDECYRRGIARKCSEHEDACFLEVRYQGVQVVGVMSGCKQKVACINDMKQNFFDFNEYNQNGVNLLDHGKHDCQLYTGSKAGNSVCRNCCFDDFCTDGWQPSSFKDWNIAQGTEVEREMMLFDQFSRPPHYWEQMKMGKTSQIPRVQVIDSLEDFNRPPTMADLVDDNGKAPVIPNAHGKSKDKQMPDFLRRQQAARAAAAKATTRPNTTRGVSDSDFMNLVAKIDGNKPAPKRPLAKRPVPKRPGGKAPGKAPGKRPGGKGPWAHLPPWKQRQLQQARQKAMAKKAAAKQAQPAAMKFSEWQPHPGTKATFDEGPIIEVETTLSDEEFSDLISSLDSKKNTDLEALVREIESDNKNSQEAAEQTTPNEH